MTIKVNKVFSYPEFVPFHFAFVSVQTTEFLHFRCILCVCTLYIILVYNNKVPILHKNYLFEHP